MGFLDTVKGQYKKGKKMAQDYQAGAEQRDKDATARFKKKTALLKEKGKLHKAKAEYHKAKAKNSAGSIFSGGGVPSLGQATKGASLAHTWSIGGAMAHDKPKKRKKRY